VTDGRTDGRTDRQTDGRAIAYSALSMLSRAKKGRNMSADVNNVSLYTHPVTTTTKSIKFQTLRKYEPLCKAKPRATILNSASTQNIPKKYTSVSSCNQQSSSSSIVVVVELSLHSVLLALCIVRTSTNELTDQEATVNCFCDFEILRHLFVA